MQPTTPVIRHLHQLACRFLSVVAPFALALQGSLCPARAAPLDFQKDVAPILEAACIRCHNDDTAKGKLSLVTLAAALKGGNDGEAIIAGKPEESPLLQMISGPKPSMPKGAAPLTDKQVQTLRDWIAQGAVWPKEIKLALRSRADESWWSLQAIKRPAVPAVTGTSPASQSHPIDAFVQAKLKQSGLTPAKEADARTLIRRVTFDLTGLPPTPEEVEAFVKEYEAERSSEARVSGSELKDKAQSPASSTPTTRNSQLGTRNSSSYVRLIDRLLASPHYGERWGRHWLDIAHYADTHGFERDMRRDSAWRYRDYVIASLNADKPYDRFIQEQIAGDILSPTDAEAVIATGFLAAGPFDYVGQIETASPLLRRQARADDLDDMVTQVMAATVGLTVNCARCHDHKLDPIPQADYYRLWAVFAGVKRSERDLPAANSDVEKRRQSMEISLRQITSDLRLLEGNGIDLADIVGNGDGTGTGKQGTGIDVRDGKYVAGKAPFLDAKVNAFVAAASPFVDGVTVPSGPGPVVISTTGITLTGLPATGGKTWDHVQFGPVTSQDTTLIDGIDYAKGDHTLLGLHANKAITFDLDAIRKKHQLTSTRFRAVAGYGGKGGDGATFGIYLDGKPALPLTNIESQSRGMLIDFEVAPTQRFLTLIALDRTGDIGHDQVFFGDPRLHRAGDLKLSPTQITQRTKLISEQATLRDAISKLPPPAQTNKVFAIVSQDMPKIHVLTRGDTESPAAEVSPSALSCISTLQASLGDDKTPEGQRRLALAKWLTDPANPLTRRVIVNRLWHYHFGTGLVATPSDFGFAGDRPSHPELLDWLAEEMLANKWSLKAMHKLILTSQTYRQSSAMNEKAAAIDAGNRLLWRMNPRRLEVEAVRDSILAVSGSLNKQMGGPGYEDFTFQAEYAPVYRYTTADNASLWRRTIYRFTVRTTQNEFLRVLDCSDPSVLTPIRNRTTTALQALALMNNRFMVQQSEHFAARLKKECGEDVSKQINRAFTLAFAREASKAEIEGAAKLVAEHGLPNLCRMLLNANEFVYVD